MTRYYPCECEPSSNVRCDRSCEKGVPQMTEDTKPMTDEELFELENEPIHAWEINFESMRRLVTALECLADASVDTENEVARELIHEASKLIRQAIRAEGV